jgi:hypothetical protein
MDFPAPFYHHFQVAKDGIFFLFQGGFMARLPLKHIQGLPENPWISQSAPSDHGPGATGPGEKINDGRGGS